MKRAAALLGLSMGATAAVVAQTQEQAARVDRLILVSPRGVGLVAAAVQRQQQPRSGGIGGPRVAPEPPLKSCNDR